MAIRDGATVVVGGTGRPVGAEHGYYVAPTVLTDVRPGSRIEQEEVFGPVLVVIAYRDEDEAVLIANDTPYGLSGAVFSADQDRPLCFTVGCGTGWSAF